MIYSTARIKFDKELLSLVRSRKAFSGLLDMPEGRHADQRDIARWESNIDYLTEVLVHRRGVYARRYGPLPPWNTQPEGVFAARVNGVLCDRGVDLYEIQVSGINIIRRLLAPRETFKIQPSELGYVRPFSEFRVRTCITSKNRKITLETQKVE